MSRLRSITTTGVVVFFGHLLFLGLLVLAMQHWQLRTIYVDSAYQIFKWINFDGLQVEAHRYAAFAPQLLVKLFAACGASLHVLLMVASVAHVLVPWVIYAMVAHMLRRPWYAAALALAAVLCTRLCFYGIVLEANYLLCYPILFAAALDAMVDRPYATVLAWLSLALVLLVHPLGAPVALFISVLHLLRATHRKPVYAMALVALIWPLIARWLFPPTAYEQGLYSGMAEGASSLRFGAQHPALDFLLGHSWNYTSHYVVFWILLITGLVMWVGRKERLTAVVVLGSVVGLVLLNMLTYHHGETAVMMEKNFLPLAVFVAIPLADVVRRLGQRGQRISALVLVIAMFIQFRGISFASRPTAERFALVQELVHRARTSGPGPALVEPQELDRADLHIHWALPAETLLASGIAGPDSCAIVSAVHVPGSVRIDPSTLDHRWFRPPSGPDHLLRAQEQE